ncbi:MAG: XRE family transcriptional regulator [Actinomycetia bacterium]|nr:XRE family transcriptional regulator [Actinomycetes bacterium]
MTVAPETQGEVRGWDRDESSSRNRAPEPPSNHRPVEFWPTSDIRAALESDDLTVWQRIVTAVKRDPYGRTARQVEEVLETARPYGVSRAISEVLERTREHLDADECAEVGRHVRLLLDRSGLGEHEFASRIGVPTEDFSAYLRGSTSPSASLMIRMGRLSERFAKMRHHHPR